MKGSSNILRRFGLVLLVTTFLLGGSRLGVLSQEKLSGFDRQVHEMAMACRDQVAAAMLKLVKGNTLTLAQLFDTFYIPIPDTDPQKYPHPIRPLYRRDHPDHSGQLSVEGRAHQVRGCRR